MNAAIRTLKEDFFENARETVENAARRVTGSFKKYLADLKDLSNRSSALRTIKTMIMETL